MLHWRKEEALRVEREIELAEYLLDLLCTFLDGGYQVLAVIQIKEAIDLWELRSFPKQSFEKLACQICFGVMACDTHKLGIA